MGRAFLLLLAVAGPGSQDPATDRGDLEHIQSLAERLGAERFGEAFVADAGKEGGRGVGEEDVTRRREKIQEELETLDGSGVWGIYTQGDGLTNISLYVAPKSGVAYTFRGCMGLYDANFGDIVHVDGRTVFLDLAVDPASNRRWYPAGLGCRVMSDEWCVVDWGDRRYMIPSSQMIPFCNAVNHGGPVDFPSRPTGESDRRAAPWAFRNWERPEELPSVPEEYRPFLLERPLHARILRTSEPDEVGEYASGEPEYHVLAEIDVGRSAGLLPGMTWVPEHGRPIKIEVVGLRDDGAQVRMHSSRPYELPRPGATLTTRRSD